MVLKLEQEMIIFQILPILAGRCPPVSAVGNAQPDGVLALPGNIVTYTCNEGYMFSDKQLHRSIQCNAGEWNDTQESCIGSELRIDRSQKLATH